MNLFSKMLLLKKKDIEPDDVYVNYITQVVPYPPARIQVDSYADDYRTINVSNITTQVGYLRFYLESEDLKLVCDSQYIYQLDGYTNGYWQIRMQPTKSGIEIENTYEIPCSIVDSDNNVVQEFTMCYTRTI